MFHSVPFMKIHKAYHPFEQDQILEGVFHLTRNIHESTDIATILKYSEASCHVLRITEHLSGFDPFGNSSLRSLVHSVLCSCSKKTISYILLLLIKD